jgi:hypothetical protein
MMVSVPEDQVSTSPSCHLDVHFNRVIRGGLDSVGIYPELIRQDSAGYATRVDR